MKTCAVVTGGAKGIGLAIAKKCLRLGMQVFLVDIDQKELQQAKKRLSQNGEVETIALDLSDESQVKQFAERLLSEVGPPHYLFNNVGVGGDMAPVWQQDTEKFKYVMDVNFYSAFYLTKAFLPAMLETKIKGVIVNIASMASFYSAPLINSYVISKHSMMAFSECLYHDLQAINANIQVAVVCPGGVKTTILDENLQSADQYELENLTEANRSFMIKFAKLIKKGMHPDVAVDMIFHALEQKQFYIFTHPEMISIIEQRLQAVIEQSNPQILIL